MTHSFNRGLMLAGVLSLAMLAGCTTYYQVSDPSTGRTYYTTKLKKKSGSTVFKDASTGSEVSIQNSEISKVTKDQYKQAIK